MYHCPKGPAFCKNSQQIILNWGNSKQENFSNYTISKESYVSFKLYICENLENTGPSGIKVHIFILLEFNDSEVLLKYFYIFIFYSGSAFQRYIDHDNPTVISDMASKNILLPLMPWTDHM